MNIVFTRCVSVILVCSVFLMGCAHSYNPTVRKPAETDDRYAWQEFYQDQFKAKGSKVRAPEDDAQDQIKEGYRTARSSWKRRVITGNIIGYGLLAIAVVLLVNTLSEASEVGD